METIAQGASVTVVGDRADDHPAPHRRDLPHGLDGIQQQIEEDLLEPDPIAHRVRQVGCHRRL
jgi:hypothetical protein